MLAHLEKVARGRQLRPDYGDGSLEWLAGQLGEKRQFGALEMLLIRNDRGVTGWFICFLEAGGIGQVVQVAAEPFQMAHVLDHLLHYARRRGVIALSGRLEPGLLPALASRGARFGPVGPWMLLHTRRPEIVAAIEQGDAFVSRLEGEWWMSF